jgi:hypothetical protein
MTRPVAEWQWTDEPAIFWLRMEHLPPSPTQLVEETYPPKPTVKRRYRHRSITPEDLKRSLAEVKATNWEQELGRTPRTTHRAQPAAIQRAAIREAAADITTRSTAVAERLLGINSTEGKAG